MGESDPTPSTPTWQDVRSSAEQARDAAHRPAAAMVGGYGHPLHPLLAAVPIGAFVATLAFDLASKAGEGRAFGRPATWLAAIGVAAGVVAAIFGAVDFLRLPRGTRARRIGTWHLGTMLVVLALFGAGFAVRRADASQYLDGSPTAAVVLSAVGVVVLVVGAWLGATMVYSFGVRVADDEDQLLGYLPPDDERRGDDA
jgi:uncharacterized membrane protein